MGYKGQELRQTSRESSSPLQASSFPLGLPSDALMSAAPDDPQGMVAPVRTVPLKRVTITISLQHQTLPQFNKIRAIQTIVGAYCVLWGCKDD